MPVQELNVRAVDLLQSLPSGFSGAQDRTFAKFFTALGTVHLLHSYHASDSSQRSIGHHFARYERESSPVPHLVRLANGVTVELGPAIGNQLPHFERNRVTRIYGLEPNLDLLDVLKTKLVDQDGMREIYIPMHAALEDDSILQAHGIVPGSVDTVVSIQVLCCVKDPDDAAKRIHRLLKPGGQFLFWEHGKSTDRITRVMQSLWEILWSPLIGGCRLSRDLEKAIMAAGPWRAEEFGHHIETRSSLMPRVWGRLIKLEE